MMGSLYRTILLWFFGFVVATVLVMRFGAAPLLMRFGPPSEPMEVAYRVFLRQAIDAEARGGQAELRRYLESLQGQLPARFYLLDAAGRDLATGEDRSEMMRRVESARMAPNVGGRFATVIRQGDRALLFLVSPPDFDPGSRRLLVVIVALIAAGLCWLFASPLARPVRSLAHVMDRFGAGDMSARSEIQRKDEIGGLARSFNEMAARIESLVTSERRLLQDLSHELQSPLARLKVAANLAAKSANPEAASARVQQEVDRMSQMVSGLLDVTRAEGDPAALRRQPVRLDVLIRSIADDCAWEAGAETPLRCDLPMVQVTGDEVLLRRALENVMRNAIRYAPGGTEVEVTLANAGAMAEITVRDRGPGVPEELLSKIFSPFFRVDREGDANGTGLGLTLTQRAVHLHQGTVSAANASPGLTVTLRLPLHKTQHNA